MASGSNPTVVNNAETLAVVAHIMAIGVAAMTATCQGRGSADVDHQRAENQPRYLAQGAQHRPALAPALMARQRRTSISSPGARTVLGRCRVDSRPVGTPWLERVKT